MLEILAYFSLNSNNIRDQHNRSIHIICSLLLIYNIYSSAIFLIGLGNACLKKEGETECSDFGTKAFYTIKQTACTLFNVGFGLCLVFNMLKIAFRSENHSMISKFYSIERYRSRNEYTVWFTSSILGVYFMVMGLLNLFWSISEVINYNVHQRYEHLGGLIEYAAAFEAYFEFIVDSIFFSLLVILGLRRFCFLSGVVTLGLVKQYSRDAFGRPEVTVVRRKSVSVKEAGVNLVDLGMLDKKEES